MHLRQTRDGSFLVPFAEPGIADSPAWGSGPGTAASPRGWARGALHTAVFFMSLVVLI